MAYVYSNVDTGGLVRADSSGVKVLAEVQPGPDDAVVVGKAIWLAGQVAQSVSATAKVTPIAIPEYTNAVEFDGRFGWFVGQVGGLYRVDPADGSVVRFETPGYPNYLTTDGDGAVFGVLGPAGGGSVIEIMRADENGITVVGGVEMSDPNVVASDVTGLFYAHGSRWLLANRVTELWRIDPSNAAVVARIPVAPSIPLVDVGGQWSIEAGFALDIVAADGDTVVAMFRHNNPDVYAGKTSFPINVNKLRRPKLVRIDPTTNTVIEVRRVPNGDCGTPMAATRKRIWGASIIGAPCVIDIATATPAGVWAEEWTELGYGDSPTPTSGRAVAAVVLR